MGGVPRSAPELKREKEKTETSTFFCPTSGLHLRQFKVGLELPHSTAKVTLTANFFPRFRPTQRSESGVY